MTTEATEFTLTDEERGAFIKAATDAETRELAEKVTQVWKSIGEAMTTEARILQVTLSECHAADALNELLQGLEAVHRVTEVIAVAARQLLHTTHH